MLGPRKVRWAQAFAEAARLSVGAGLATALTACFGAKTRNRSRSPISAALMLDAGARAIGVGLTFDPFSGTLDAMVSDGRLNTVGDARLRESLASWITRLDARGKTQRTCVRNRYA